jgi:hypothetical protein
MFPLLVLPAPVPSTSFALGQLVTDPLNADFASLKPSETPEYEEPVIQSKYQDTIHDAHGFLSSASGQAHYSHENPLLIDAEQMSHITIERPAVVFNTLLRDGTTRAFLRKMAHDNKPVYFVTGIQTLKNSNLKHAVGEHGLITEATSPQFRLPVVPVKRVDSASSISSTSPTAQDSDESILAIQLLKLKCRVGSPSEPHCISDLDYEWSYHSLEDNDDLQLSIGLGKALETSELRALAGMANQEDSAEGSWSSNYSDDGVGGF